jgi:hypothetical protein
VSLEEAKRPQAFGYIFNDIVGESGAFRRRRSNRPGNSQAKGPRFVNL